MKLKKIENIKQQNYLEENGLYPVYVLGETAYYEKTTELFNLLDEYFIITQCFR